MESSAEPTRRACGYDIAPVQAEALDQVRHVMPRSVERLSGRGGTL
jgi:hypothetical protein